MIDVFADSVLKVPSCICRLIAQGVCDEDIADDDVIDCDLVRI
jgi:hypothetical protein